MAPDPIKGQLPLAGMIMCCTSILPDHRQSIAAQVTEMGAVHKYDLTSDVTHLIVGSVTTTKYQYVANERPDVKVVLPSFVEAVRESWLEGGEPDVAAFEEQHYAPPFFGLRICFTGFEDLQVRESLSAIIQANGGDYQCDLIRGVVTTLIAKKPEGRKYDHALKWDIPVVSHQWLHESVERGMALHTALFDPRMPSEQQGQRALKPMATDTVTLGKRQRENVSANTLAESGKRKLRRTLSSKLESQTEAIWADIADAASSRQPSQPRRGVESRPMSADVQDNSNLHSTKLHVRPDATGNSRKESIPQEVEVDSFSIRANPIGLFHGVNISIHGFEGKKLKILREHLLSHGARLLDVDQLDPENVEEQCFLIVPVDVPGFMLPPIPEAASLATRVTEWWVESCMHKKRVVDPEDDRLSKPFARLTMDGLEGILICSTGFKDSDLLHVSKVVNLMGGTYDEFLKQSTSVLLCKSEAASLEKLQYAAEHQIPAVSEYWLLQSIEMGSVQPFDDYTIQPIPPRHSTGNQEAGQSQLEKPSSLSTRRIPPPSRKPQQPGLFDRPSSSKPKALRELSDQSLNGRTPSPEKEHAKEGEATETMRGFDGNTSVEPRQSSMRELHRASVSASAGALKESITALLARKGEASVRRDSFPDTTAGNLSRRKRGLLGRAPSGISNTSSANDATDLLAHASQVDVGKIMPAPTQSQRIGWRDKEEAEATGLVRDTVADAGGGAARAAGRRKRTS